ncbi:MAG: cellulose binding domain-containing protein [Myxococcota bacterium]|nr:cellulose binding domain-containing protein [Myxococcota bacterium]
MLLTSILFACSEYALNELEQPPLGSENEPAYLEESSSALTDDTTDLPTNNSEIATRADCNGNQSPELIDWSPQNESILAQDSTTILEAWVNDPNGDDVWVSWQDENGNTLFTGQADDRGYVSYTWDEAHEPGELQLTVIADDGCENTHRAINLCQQAGYSQDELQLSQWHLEGDAERLENGEIELTGLETFQLGSAFMTDSIVSANDVHIRFEYKTEGGTGADGISLTALDVDRMTSFLGGDGCGIGYGGGVGCTDSEGLPGWSIEIDTWFNGEQPDPTPYDHVAFSFDGDIAHPAAWHQTHELEETGWHTVEITVVAPHVRVVIDNYLYLDQEIEGNFDFPAYIGFTGSTGGQTNIHRIRSLTVEEKICDTGEMPETETVLPPPDLPTPDSNIEFDYIVDSDWGAGYCARVNVRNIGANASNWDIPLPIDGTISSQWGCEWEALENTWLFTGEGHNYSIDTGSQTSFGFCVNR